MMAGKKYWDVMYTLCPSTSLQMPNIELGYIITINVQLFKKLGDNLRGQKSLGPL
jgi:hypothetical protein